MLYSVLFINGVVCLYKCYTHDIMKKDATKQINFRLPEPLIAELKRIAEAKNESQTSIVQKAVEHKIAQYDTHLKRKEAAQAA